MKTFKEKILCDVVELLFYDAERFHFSKEDICIAIEHLLDKWFKEASELNYNNEKEIF